MKTIKKALSSNYPISLADQAIVSLGAFFTNIILIRTMGLSGFGSFNLVWITILFFLGMQQALIIAPLQVLSGRKSESEKVVFLTHTVLLFFIQLILFTCVILSCIHFNFILTANVFKTNTLLLIANLFLYLLNDYLRKLFFVLNKKLVALLVDTVSLGLQLLLLLAFRQTGVLTVSNALFAAAASSFVSVIYAAWHCGFLKQLTFKGFITSTKECLKQSRWLFGSSILQWTSGNYFIAAAAIVLDATALGAIRMVQNIMGCINVIFSAFENFIPVKASALYHHSGVAAMWHYLRKAGFISGLLIMPLLTIIFFNADFIITKICGETYDQYGFLMQGFAVLYVFIFAGTQLRFAARSSNRTNVLFIAYVISSAFGLLAAPIIIKNFKETGVVMGLVASQIIIIICLLTSLKKEIRYIWKLYM